MLVAAPDRQGQRSRMAGGGLTGPARVEKGFAEAVERFGLPGAVAGLAVEGQRPPQVADGLATAALP
jgi:hypothetical protein